MLLFAYMYEILIDPTSHLPPAGPVNTAKPRSKLAIFVARICAISNNKDILRIMFDKLEYFLDDDIDPLLCCPAPHTEANTAIRTLFEIPCVVQRTQYM